MSKLPKLPSYIVIFSTAQYVSICFMIQNQHDKSRLDGSKKAASCLVL